MHPWKAYAPECVEEGCSEVRIAPIQYRAASYVQNSAVPSIVRKIRIMPIEEGRLSAVLARLDRGQDNFRFKGFSEVRAALALVAS
jgi:hypothetical protein